jgi:DNA end-binding protein Ku
VELKPQELAMAASLVESMASDFDPSEYTDEYRTAVLAMIEDKLAGGDGVVAGQSVEQGTSEVLDLMAALEASVARARENTAVKSTTDHAPVAEPKPDKVKKAIKTTARKPKPAKVG